MDAYALRSRLDALTAAAERFGVPLPEATARHAAFADELGAQVWQRYDPTADLESAYATAGKGRADRIASVAERIAADAAMASARPAVAEALSRAATRHLRAAYTEATGPEVGAAFGAEFDRSALVFVTAWTALRARLGPSSDVHDRAALLPRPDAVDAVAEHVAASLAADDLDALAGVRGSFPSAPEGTDDWWSVSRSCALIDWGADLEAARNVRASGFTGAPTGLDWGIPLDQGARLAWADQAEAVRRVDALRAVDMAAARREIVRAWSA